MRFKIDNNNLTLIKYLALILMVIAHIDKYFLNENNKLFFIIGRLCMPLFLMVLTYNLSRYDGIQHQNLALKMALRLFIFAIISTPFYILLGGVIWGWFPLNILFALSTICFLTYLISLKKYFFTFLVILIMGFCVEYFWGVLFFGIFSWLFFKKYSYKYGILSTISLLSISFMLPSTQFWALISIPIFFILALLNLNFKLPRKRQFFYVFYPLHLCLFLIIQNHEKISLFYF